MIRRTLFWLHLIIGMTAGLAILVMSMTGVILAFERQALQFADRPMRSVLVPASASPREIGDLLRTVSASAQTQPTAVVVRPDPSASVEFVFGRERTIYVDPYSAAVLGEGSKPARTFFSAVQRWHRTLGEPLGARGPLRAIAAASNLVFLAIIVTGLLLWWPRRLSWASIRPTLWLKRGLVGRSRDFNWHNVGGFWMALPLALVALTGVIISYPWANAALFQLAGSSAPAGRPDAGRAPAAAARGGALGPFVPVMLAADLDKALAVARGEVPDARSFSLRLPGPTDTSVTVTADKGTGGQVEKRTELTIDTRSGVILTTTRFSDNPLARRLRSLARFVHTGEAGGIPGQILAALASAVACVLVWTGMALSIRRLRRYLLSTKGGGTAIEGGGAA